MQSPLVAVQQYLDVLKHLGESPNTQALQNEWIDRSLARIKELIAIVRDWLTISKIESGQFIECLGKVSLKPLIEELLQTYAEHALEKNVNLISQLNNNLCLVKAHKDCLKMLFSNLIVNAIKYNKKDGLVKITAKETTGHIIVSVSDTGIGIPEDKLEIIFEEFYRVKDESTKNISGTGLGLPICKKIVTELDGKIEVASKLHNGSTFKIFLPKYKD